MLLSADERSSRYIEVGRYISIVSRMLEDAIDDNERPRCWVDLVSNRDHFGLIYGRDAFFIDRLVRADRFRSLRERLLHPPLPLLESCRLISRSFHTQYPHQLKLKFLSYHYLFQYFYFFFY